MKRQVAVAACALAAWTCTATLPATGADSQFPNRPVRFLIPSSPGGGTDLTARVIGQRLSERWGQPVVMENRAGATGYVALEGLARSAPDGHTLAILNVGHMLVAQDSGKLSFKRGGDFTPIAASVTTPLLLVVHPSIPVKSVKEFVEYARARPGELNYASGGTGGSAHISVAIFANMTGINLTHVPYKGVAPGIVDLLAGRVQLVLTVVAVGGPHVQTGRLRALAITGPKRVTALPEVPTFAEAGYPTYDTSSWYGLFGPARMPASLVARVHADSEWVAKQPDVANRLVPEGIYPTGGMTTEQFAGYVATELVKWSEAVKAAGVN